MKEDKIYRDPVNNRLVSIVKQLTSKVEVETVFHNSEAEKLMIYLDAAHPNPFGPHRPRIRIGFDADGCTVNNIELYNDGGEVIMRWDK